MFYRADLRELDETALPAGNVLVRIHYSTLNYKDALAITGKGSVIRKFPMVPGIDLVGAVEESSHADYRIGDMVVLSGCGVGETHWGGLAEMARLNGVGWCHCLQPSRPIKQWPPARPDSLRCFACWHLSSMVSLPIAARSS